MALTNLMIGCAAATFLTLLPSAQAEKSHVNMTLATNFANQIDSENWNAEVVTVANDTTPALQQLMSIINTGETANLQFGGPEELFLNPTNECGLVLNQYKAKEMLEMDQNWDGSWKPGTVIGRQIRVFFTDVSPQHTQSYDTEQDFVVKFYDESESYGRQEHFELSSNSAGAPPMLRFLFDDGRNLSSGRLGMMADGATFTLSFPISRKQQAVTAIKKVFAECPYDYRAPVCSEMKDFGGGCGLKLDSDGNLVRAD